MNQSNASMTVIGVGPYGTTLAIIPVRDGHQVVLWGHGPKHVTTLEHDHCSVTFLPDVLFPGALRLESDLATTLATSRSILVVVSNHVFGEILCGIKPLIHPDVRLAWAIKGLEAGTGCLPRDVAREVLGDSVPLAVTSGPTFARELVTGMPTAISLTLTDDTFADDPQQLLYCGKSLRVHNNPDFTGVQPGGAVKNVIAISVGISDGIGFGASARTALVACGLTEMSRFGTVLRADPATFMGMVGLGNLVLTRTGNQSHNRRFSMMPDQRMNVQGAQDGTGQVVEGYRNTKGVCELAHCSGAEIPIAEEIYQVLYCGKNAHEAALTSLGRARKDELSRH